jgi:hypothetical protein
MNEIERQMTNESLTLEEVNNLDGEWDILDAELAMYDDMLAADHYRQMWEISQLEEPLEREIYVQDREDEEDYDWTNPSDEDVARWDEERLRTSGWTCVESKFDLGDEV